MWMPSGVCYLLVWYKQEHVFHCNTLNQSTGMFISEQSMYIVNIKYQYKFAVCRLPMNL